MIVVVLPKMENRVALSSQRARYSLIAAAVCGYLLVPPSPVVLGRLVTAGASMPKASIDEDGDLWFGQN